MAVCFGQYDPIILCRFEADGERQTFMADMPCTVRSEGMMKMRVFQFQHFQHILSVVSGSVVDNYHFYSP